MEDLRAALAMLSKKTPTENGATVEASTGEPLLNADQMLVRGVADPGGITRSVIDAASRTVGGGYHLLVLLFVLLFKKRNCRGGEGEKDISYKMFIELYDTYPETCMLIVDHDLFGVYGCYKDYFRIWELVCARHTSSGHAVWTKKYKRLICRIGAKITHLRYETLKRHHAGNSNEEVMKDAFIFKWCPSEGSHFDKLCFIFDEQGRRKLSAVDYLSIAEFLATSADAKPLMLSEMGLKKKEKEEKKTYRKNNTLFRGLLDIPENKFCSQRWSEITLNNICSRALTLYRRALLNENKDGTQRSSDPERVALGKRMIEFIAKARVKGGQLFPHELLKKMISASSSELKLLKAQWKDLRLTTCAQLAEMMTNHIISGGESIVDMMPNFLCCADLSGSMSGIPIEVSTGLAVFFCDFTHLYIDFLHTFADFLENDWSTILTSKDITTSLKQSAYCKEYPMMLPVLEKLFKSGTEDTRRIGDMMRKFDKKNFLNNQAIAFSMRPRHFTFPDSSDPIDNYNKLMTYVEHTNTNFLAVVEQLLLLCVMYKIPAEGIPSLLVITDGQFDQMNVNLTNSRSYPYSRSPINWQTCHQTIMQMFLKARYTRMCDFIYWNVRANTPGFQTSATHPGVQMMTGFSPAIMRDIMMGKSEATTTEVDVVTADGTVQKMTTSTVTPWDTLLKTLNEPIYDAVRAVLISSTEGTFANYNGPE